MTSTSHDLATIDLDGTVVGEVLRASDKSLLALGHRNGLPVVIKALRTDEEFWQGQVRPRNPLDAEVLHPAIAHALPT